jgi:hypothetical protein
MSFALAHASIASIVSWGTRPPTAPLFGRFIEWTGRGPKVLSGQGKSAVLRAEYVYRFRAVGMIGRDADLYTRSEIPVPIPSAAERQVQPAEFDVLQHHVKALDSALAAMATATDMVGELDEADKSSEHDQYLNRRYRPRPTKSSTPSCALAASYYGYSEAAAGRGTTSLLPEDAKT